MADNWMLGETAALDDYIPNAPTNYLGDAATAAKDWYAAQPSWLDRARAENQKTSEAFQRGGMGEIARQLATDTTEPQELYGAFGVGNIKGVKPPVAPGALAATSEYRPPFYSAVEQAVQGAKQNVAPGQQWAGFLRNQPGVKQEEVQALGLGKLFEQPSVSKEAMLGEIAANRVNVGETVKGAPDSKYAEMFLRGELNGDPARFGFDTPEKVLAEAGRRGFEGGNSTKFSQYTLPGGENYREMLLTLPEAKPKAVAEFEKFKQQLEIKHGTHLDSPYDVAKWAGSDTADQYEKLLRQAQDAQRAPGGMNFKSSHYDEPNILAHVRYNDRVIDGKKTLFVEEVQSDWHQKGKREGYGTTQEPGKVAQQGNHAWRVEWSDGSYAHYSSEAAAQEAAARRTASKGGVPDAPFKTTWPELAMKRIIREAAEKGYDKVAWTPGSVQAERYDLSKHVKKIDYNPESGKLWGYDHTGTTVMDTRINSDKLADYIGKDAAEKLLKTQADKGWHRLEGTDLKVGGEGMQGFYDEILPATVNRLVKKHGGRVQQGNLAKPPEMDLTQRDPSGRPAMKFENQPVHTLDITPSLRAQAMKGFPLFTAGGVAATGVISDLARQDEYR